MLEKKKENSLTTSMNEPNESSRKLVNPNLNKIFKLSNDMYFLGSFQRRREKKFKFKYNGVYRKLGTL